MRGLFLNERADRQFDLLVQRVKEKNRRKKNNFVCKYLFQSDPPAITTNLVQNEEVVEERRARKVKTGKAKKKYIF
jgi:hypothetical protein